jgi:hypothetical protein
MAYEYQEFPSFVSGPNGERKIVQSADELAALGDGWKMPERVPFTPRQEAPDFEHYPKWVNGVIVADADAEAALLAQTASPERAVLLQIAEEKGVQIDKRWSDARIRAAIEAA